MWVLYTAPCPTPDGRTAEELYHWRLTAITEDMQASAREFGCQFHRAWYTADGSMFVAIAKWDTEDGAHAFFEKWNINDEPVRSPIACSVTSG